MPPSQKLKPRVIIQHHSTSFPLSLHPAVPSLLGTVDSCFAKSTVLKQRHPSGFWSLPWPAGHLPLHRNKPLQLQSTQTDTRDNKPSCSSSKNKHRDTAAQTAAQNGVRKRTEAACDCAKFVMSSLFSGPEDFGEADAVSMLCSQKTSLASR